MGISSALPKECLGHHSPSCPCWGTAKIYLCCLLNGLFFIIYILKVSFFYSNFMGNGAGCLFPPALKRLELDYVCVSLLQSCMTIPINRFTDLGAFHGSYCSSKSEDSSKNIHGKGILNLSLQIRMLRAWLWQADLLMNSTSNLSKTTWDVKVNFDSKLLINGPQIKESAEISWGGFFLYLLWGSKSTPGLTEALVTNSHCTAGFLSTSRRISTLAQHQQDGEGQGLRKVCLLEKSYQSVSAVTGLQVQQYLYYYYYS